jgi:hypothetical protein
VAVFAALGVVAAAGLLPRNLGLDERRVRGNEAALRQIECVHARVDALVPDGSRVYVEPDGNYFWHRELSLAVFPESTVVSSQDEATIAIRATDAAGGCDGVDVVAERVR